MALICSPASGTAVSKALDEFQASLSDERRAQLLALRTVPGPNDVLKFTADIDDEIVARKRSRCVSSRFCTILERIKDYAAVMDTYSQVKADTTSLIWGSIKLCIHVASSAASYYDKLSEWFMKLGTLCPRLSAWQSLFPYSKALQQALDLFFSTVIQFCTQAVLVLDRTGALNFVASLWTPFEVKFGKFERSLRHQRAEIDDVVRFATTEAAMQDIKAGTSFRDMLTKTFSTWRTTDDDRNKMIDRAKSLSRKERLLDKLSSFDYKAGLKEYRKKRHGSTCSWLMMEQKYRSWIENQSNSFFWLSGGVGVGKSVIVASVVDNILRHHVHGDNTAVTFFFCKENDAESVRATGILRSLIRQCLKADAVSDTLCTTISEILANGAPEPDELAELFALASSQFLTHFVVIDGLDECVTAQRRDVMDVLGHVTASSQPRRFKVFVACSDNIKKEVPPSFKSPYSLTVSRRHVDADIAAFVDETLRYKISRGELIVGNLDLVEEVKHKLVKGANGMFLWVEFQIQEICEQSCDDDIRQVISALPRGLRDTYHRILQRVSQRGRAEIAERVFCWTGTVRRPLVLEELREALTVQPDQESFRRDRLINGFENMASWCGNLVTLDEESGAVQFAHSTVKHYLFSDAVLNGFHCVFAEANTAVGEACVTYLCFSDFERRLVKTSKLDLAVDPVEIATTSLASAGSGVLATSLRALAKLRIGPCKAKVDSLAPLLETKNTNHTLATSEYSFLAYALQHWLAHTARFNDDVQAWANFRRLVLEDGHFASLSFQLQSSNDEKVLPRFILQFQHKALLKSLLRWRQRLLHNHIVELFHAFCDLGMAEMVKIVLQSNRITDNHIVDRIKSAAAADDFKTLDMLIGMAADTTVRNRYLAQALFVAAQTGQFGVVHKLIAAGADVNAVVDAKNSATSLAAAMKQAGISMFNLLVDYGAKVSDGYVILLVGDEYNPGRLQLLDAQDEYLQLLPDDVTVACVEHLLHAGVRVNRERGSPTALQSVAAQGLAEVAALLLRAGADVNARPGSYNKTALQAAATGGHLNMVYLLLSAGADVNAEPGTYERPIAHGCLTFTMKSMGDGADVNAKQAWEAGRTALQAAAQGGNIKLVNHLLDAGADVNAGPAYEDGRTALQAAAEGGRLKIVNRLLDAGADVNAKRAPCGGRTALQLAAAAGNVEMVVWLLHAGAEVDAERWYSEVTTLQEAVTAGSLEIVNLLLDVGAEVTTNALLAAVRAGSVAIFDRLLKAGARLDEGSHLQSQTALQVAAAAGHEAMVKRLIAAGADVNAPPMDNGGRTALQAAAEAGNLEIVNRLLDAGAEANADPAPVKGRTALQAAAACGNWEVINRLTTAGAHLNQDPANEDGVTVYEAAVEAGHTKIAQYLRSVGARVRETKSDGD